MTRPSRSLNWYEPGASGIDDGGGRSSTGPSSRIPPSADPSGPVSDPPLHCMVPAWYPATYDSPGADNPAVGDQAGIAIENLLLFNEKREILLGSLRALVVSIEARDRYLRGHSERVSEIGLAVMATTFTICAVFVPIAFMEGTIGKFFFAFGVTVVVAVLVSLFVSFTLDPMLSSVWPDPPRTKKRFIDHLFDLFTEVEFRQLWQRLSHYQPQSTMLVATVREDIAQVIGHATHRPLSHRRQKPGTH